MKWTEKNIPSIYITIWVLPAVHEREEGSWRLLSSSCVPSTFAVFAPFPAISTCTLFFLSLPPSGSAPLPNTLTHSLFSAQTLRLMKAKRCCRTGSFLHHPGSCTYSLEVILGHWCLSQSIFMLWLERKPDLGGLRIELEMKNLEV